MVTTPAFLLYDTRRIMVATLTKNASGTSWNAGHERSGVRFWNATCGPKGQFCTNLGHVQDDESGLIYMRARYYEPSTGRFISEDPKRDGWIRYLNCSSKPILDVDRQGTVSRPAFLELVGNVLIQFGVFLLDRTSLLTVVGMTQWISEKVADGVFQWHPSASKDDDVKSLMPFIKQIKALSEIAKASNKSIAGQVAQRWGWQHFDAYGTAASHACSVRRWQWRLVGVWRLTDLLMYRSS